MKTQNEILTIEPRKGLKGIDLKELWQFRELLYFFTWRDILVRYKQTLLGVLWALIQPLATMLIFAIFFGRLAKIPSDGSPYPIFVYAGLLPWQLFSQSLSRSSESIVGNANLIKKVYFPRLLTPLSASVAALVDFCVAFVVLIGLMVYYQYAPTTEMLLVPVLIFLTFLCSVGFGLCLSTLNALYRDVRYIVPFALQLGMFVTPVIYPVSIAPEKWAWVLYLNPMAGIIESFRVVLLGSGSIPMFGLMMSVGITVTVWLFGMFFFRNMEKRFADVI